MYTHTPPSPPVVLPHPHLVLWLHPEGVKTGLVMERAELKSSWLEEMIWNEEEEDRGTSHSTDHGLHKRAGTPLMSSITQRLDN